VRWGAVALALLLAGVAWAAQPLDTPGTSAFRASDRPVAGIISTESDIGAGLGYYTVRIARRLGPGATIYATDVKSEYLDQLKARLARERITGVQLVLGLPWDPQLPTDSVDVTILSHMYHEIENPYEFLYRLQPSLTPGARVGIIDMDRPTQNHGTPPALLRCEMAAVGYRQLDFVLLNPADGYLAVFARPANLPPAGGIKPCRQ